MNNPRWCWLVRWSDPLSRLVSERRFLWERSAQAYAERLEQAGFCRITVTPTRVKINQRREAVCDLGRE